MKRLFMGLVLVLLFQPGWMQAQKKFTIQGYIQDAGSGEELIGSTVYIKEIADGTVTNVYGFYSMTLSPGKYQINFSYIGYQSITRSIDLKGDLELNVEMKAETVTMEEVLITGEALDANVTEVSMSRNKLNINQVKRLPALMGEPDIIKTIQMMPGVISAGEGTSSFFVRGGSADQNLILIDEAPVYDPSHLFGLFSVFNADVIKDSELYKGGIPARYGGRLSSILDVRTIDGNNKKLGMTGGVGTLASRFMVEGPIRKDKSSFVLSGRRSYIDVFLRAANEDNLVYFYDVNAKVNWKPNNNNRFFVALYRGRDDFTFEDNFGFDWGNTTATFRWNHLFSDKLFSNTTLIASNFDYGLRQDDPVEGFDWESNLQEFSFKEDLSLFLNPRNELQFGYHLTWRRYSPANISPIGESSIFKPVDLQKLYALDHSLYAGVEQRLSDKLTLQYGLRLSVFQNVGETDVYLYEDPQDNININRTDTLSFGNFENIKTYVNLEPRFAARYMVNPRSSVKVSYNRMVQNTHLISSGTVPLPFNTWYPSSYYLEPQLADQYAIGYFRNLKDNAYEFSIEGYYKDINNVTDFADNADIFFNEDLSTEFRQGDSWSYGVELMLQKQSGPLTGFASYTWSKTEREVSGVNLDRTFLANYDRRNTFNVVGTYELNDKWTLGASFTYQTGRPITLPGGRWDFDRYRADVITERNGYKLPDYHRLDLSATLTPRKNKDRKWQSSWIFSIYNAYSRKNAFTIYTRVAQDDDGEIIGDGTDKEARLVYLFPILPSITYNFKF